MKHPTIKHTTKEEDIKSDITNILNVYEDNPDPERIKLYTIFILATISQHKVNARIKQSKVISWISFGIAMVALLFSIIKNTIG